MDSERERLQAELARAEARLAALGREQAEMRACIDLLRRKLAAHEGAGSDGGSALGGACSAPTNPAAKIALFRGLFRGRADVFPRLWVNARKGTQGYAPACANEWAPGLCQKPRVKCGECPARAFLPVDDAVVRDHLQGRHVIGVYPMLPDETCWLLAADFDGEGWKEDIGAFVETCAAFDLPAAVERSRSGNGGHVWFFFEAPVEARVARQMGSALLTRTMARRHQLSIHTYDRLFPNQDTLPRGGFGNLIALPLQLQARRAGNTVFVDGQWEPFPDQWAFLAACPRIPVSRVHELAVEADRGAAVLGVRAWDAGEVSRRKRGAWDAVREPISEPLPGRVVAVLDGRVSVDKAGLPSPLLDRIRRLAAFQNPEFYKRQALRLSTALTPRMILCAEETAERIFLARGCLVSLEKLLRAEGVELVLEDRRVEGELLEVRFHGELTAAQQEAADALLAHETGVLVAPPGAGKTVLGIALVAARRRTTLVLVHRTQLLDQWRSRLSLFLDRPLGEIGQIGGGKRKITGRLDVAMLQSLVGRGAVDSLVARYGQVLVDECHHVPAASFERVLREVRARFVLGLTATPRRRDGLHPILEFQLGPPRHTIAARQVALGFEQRLYVRETEFRMEPVQEALGIQELYRRLALDEARNRRILDDILQALEERRSPIVLTERRDHLDFFEEALGGVARNLVVLHGGLGIRQRREIAERLASIPEGQERLLLATGRFIGEGFDDARLDTLFLALPVSWRGTLVQYAGRLNRSRQGKTEVRIFDYVDRGIPMLEKMFAKRLAGYRGMGYRPVAAAGLEQGTDEGGYVIDYDGEDPEAIGLDPD